MLIVVEMGDVNTPVTCRLDPRTGRAVRGPGREFCETKLAGPNERRAWLKWAANRWAASASRSVLLTEMP
jgi:hypothetical protein